MFALVSVQTETNDVTAFKKAVTRPKYVTADRNARRSIQASSIHPFGSGNEHSPPQLSPFSTVINMTQNAPAILFDK